MEKKNQVKLFVILILVAMAAALFLASGCVTSKGKLYTLSDSTNVKSTSIKDSSVVEQSTIKKDSSKRIEDAEYWRKIIEYGNRPDTTIVSNNYYPQPTRIIYEGGKSRTEETRWSLDSSTFRAFTMFMLAQSDSTNVRLERIEKTKRSSGLGFGAFLTFALIGVGLILLNKGVSFLGNNYSITKKSV